MLTSASTGTRTRRALVMIATYNERENLEALLTRVWSAADVDVLLIDDSSPDGTGAIADVIASAEPRLTVVHRATKDGVASAHLLAFRHALDHGYERVVEMDADFSHLPEDIPALLAACPPYGVSLGSRCVAGSRIVGRAGWRNLLTRVGGGYARRLLGLAVHDCTGGFRCTHADALRTIDLDRVRSSGYGFQLELNWAWKRAGVAVVEVPIVFADRTAGTSKMSLAILVESLVMVLRLRCGVVRCAAAARDPAPAADAALGSVGP